MTTKTNKFTWLSTVGRRLTSKGNIKVQQSSRKGPVMRCYNSMTASWHTSPECIAYTPSSGLTNAISSRIRLHSWFLQIWLPEAKLCRSLINKKCLSGWFFSTSILKTREFCDEWGHIMWAKCCFFIDTLMYLSISLGKTLMRTVVVIMPIKQGQRLSH